MSMINLNSDDKKFFDEMFIKLEKKLQVAAVNARNIIPYSAKDNKYVEAPCEGITWWTNGFFGGLMWLMYSQTKNEQYEITAKNHEKMLDEAFKNYEGLQHDVGFIWGLISKASYKLTENRDSYLRAIYAANLLAGRANIKGGFIRAWSFNQTQKSIIDSMMNLNLLYWASEVSSDNRFTYIAKMHADMTMKEHIRDDGSVIHIVVHDEETPKVIETLGGQGYCDGSAWSRGQAWAVYGFLISYLHTKDEKYLEVSKKTADYYIENVKRYNYKSPVDFKQPESPLVYDNSAGACVSCGLIELYKVTKEEKYLEAAIKILKAMEEDCDFDLKTDSIVQNCAERYGGEPKNIVYADFYLAEALLKLKNNEFFIW